MFFIIYVLLFSPGEALIRFDIKYIDTNDQYGKAEVTLHLKELVKESNSYARACDIYNSAFDWFGSSKKCDFQINSRICFYLKNLTKVDLQFFIKFNEPSFVSGHYKNSDDTFRSYLSCGKIGKVPLSDNKDEYYDANILLNSYYGYFNMYVHLTFLVIERDYWSAWYDFGQIDTFVLTRYTRSLRLKMLKDTEFTATKRVYTLTTNLKQTYRIFSKCYKDHYGETCWYYCNNDTTHNCVCKNPSVFVSADCNITCNPGWLGYYTSYLVEDHRELMKICNTVDLCYFLKPHQCIHTCLPVNNRTYYCEQLNALLTSEMSNKKNITSEVYYLEEYIDMAIDNNVIIHKDMLANSSLQLISESEVFQSQVLRRFFSDTSFLVNDGKIDVYYNYSIMFNLNDWERTIIKVVVFRIFDAPKTISIKRDNNNSTVNHYVYIGETLTCNASSRPEYRTLHSWKGDLFNQTFPFGYELTLAPRTPIKRMFLGCTAMLLAKGRPPFIITVDKYVYVKAFVYFQWNSKKDIFEEGEILICISKAYIDYNKHIEQLDGRSNVKVVKDSVYLSHIIGGKYAFMCFLETHIDLVYHRYTTFEMRKDVVTMCFYLYPNVKGSIIQCGHDGYFPDEYLVTLEYFEYSNGIFISKTFSFDYAKVSYKIESNVYKVVCKIDSLLHRRTNKSKTIESTLLKSYEAVYALTDDVLNCPSYAPYIQKPPIIRFTKDGVLLKHYLFILNLPYLSEAIVVIIIAIVFAVLILIVIYFVGVIADQPVTRTTTLVACKRTRKGVRMRYLHDRLTIETFKFITMSPEQVQVYTRGNLFSDSFLQNRYGSMLVKSASKGTRSAN